MYVEQLRLYQLRNFSELSIPLSQGVNIFLGKNGQGKTNLVESVYLLSCGKSFRSSKLDQLIQHGNSEASVSGKIICADDEYQLTVTLEPRGKKAFLNEEALSSLVKIIGKLPLIHFSPNELELVQGGPEFRRKLLDKYLSELDAAYFQTLLEYQRALKSKAAALKLGASDKRKIQTWNEILAPLAARIRERREAFLPELQDRARFFHEQYGGFDGELELKLKANIRAESQEDIFSAFEQNLMRELQFRKCLCGPQRDDVDFFLDGRLARAFASQGQSRSFVLSLKLGLREILEEELGEKPVIILDDVESELDRGRSADFFRLLIEAGGQVFVTGTELPEVFQDRSLEPRVFEIEEGRLREQERYTPKLVSNS